MNRSAVPQLHQFRRPLVRWVLAAALLVAVPFGLWAQSPAPALAQWVDLFNGKDLTGWNNINTAEDTWKWRDGMLVCTGKPIGVMCSRKQYRELRAAYRVAAHGGRWQLGGVRLERGQPRS